MNYFLITLSFVTIISYKSLPTSAVTDDHDNNKFLSVVHTNQLSLPRLIDSFQESPISSDDNSNISHLYNLPDEILHRILYYANSIGSRGVNKLFYNLVTGEHVGDVFTGLDAYSTSYGIKSIPSSFLPAFHEGRNIIFDFSKSSLKFSSLDPAPYIPNRIVSNKTLKDLPTWFCRNWITEMIDVPYDQVLHLKNTNVRSLNFMSNQEENKMMADKAPFYVENLKDSNLRHLNLTNQNIGSTGPAVAEKLKNIKIFYLNLSNNNIGSYAGDVVKSLQGSYIKCLVMMNNNIQNNHALDLAESLKKSSFKHVLLSKNNLNEDSQRYIQDLNPTIHFIF